MKPLNVLSAGLLLAAGACATPVRADVYQLVSTKPAVPVKSVSVLPASMSFYLGDTTRQLAAKFLPTNASNKKVTWKSSDLSKAKVSASGLVTKGSAAADTDTVTITVKTADGGFQNTCLITYTNIKVPVASVSIDQAPGPITLSQGSTVQLSATLHTASSAAPTNTNITWSSDDSSVAVDASGLVTAVSNNTAAATITVTTEDGNKTAAIPVRVFTPVTGISLDHSIFTVAPSGTVTLKVTVTPSTASVQTVAWTTDSGTASLSTTSTTGSGSTITITGVSLGTAHVTATLTDPDSPGSPFHATSTVTTGVAMTGLTFSQSALGLVAGETASVMAAVSPSTTTNKTLTWSSSSANATVDSATGLVTAHAAGTAVITATAADGSGVSQTLSVSVEAGPVVLGGSPLTASSSYAGAVLAVDADSSVPYIAYRDASGNGVVKKYDGGWVTLPNFSVGDVLADATGATNIALAVDSGIPYVAYSQSSDGTAVVKSYSGTVWTAVGPAANGLTTTGSVSVGAATYLSLSFNTGHFPMVGVVDNGAPFAGSQKASCMHFNGVIWAPTGTAEFSGANAVFTSVGFDPTGIPTDYDHYYIAVADNFALSLLVDNFTLSLSNVFLNTSQLPSSSPRWITLLMQPNSNIYIADADSLHNPSEATLYTYNRSTSATNRLSMMGSGTGAVDRVAYVVDPRNDTSYVAYRDTAKKLHLTKLPGTISATAAGTDVLADVSTGAAVANVGIAMDGAGVLYVLYETGASGGTITVKQFGR